jgi:hypothetical protein
VQNPPPSPSPSSSRLSAWLVVLGCVAVALGLGGPTILYCGGGGGGLTGLTCQWSFNHNGTTGDWRYFAEAWEAARVALVNFHQLPSWNPYHCGGLVLYQDPQAPFPGPIFLLTFWWLPTGAAIKVWIMTHLLAGTLGARALIKDRGGNGAEQLLGAVLMAACGFVAWHTGGGHLSFTPFLFFPAVLWAFRRSLRDARWALVVAGLFALSFYEGATYPIPLMLVGLGVEVAARLGSPDDRRAMVPSLAIVFTLFPLLAGLRLLPVLAYLGEHPRLVPLDDQISLGEVLRTWLLPMHERAFPGHIYVWDEYADYVGLVPIAIMLAGVVVALVRRDQESRQRRIDLVLLAVMVWCALGNIPGASLFGLLHELPIYKSLRVPSRFLGPAMAGFALVAVSALMALRRTAAERRLRPRLMKALLAAEVVLVLAIAIDVSGTNAQRMQQGMDPALPRTPASSDFYQAAGADYGRFPTFPVRGIGTRQCYVPLEWKPAPGIQDGKIPQQKVEPPEAGVATPVSWSPNAIAIDVQLKTPAVLIINQNYETGWRTSTGTVGAYLTAERRQWTRPAGGGGPATPPVGMLSVALPAGTHHVVLRHRPPGLALGLVLFLIGLGLAVAVARGLTPERLEALRARASARLFE